MALALPLLDVCVAILRRFLRRVSIFQADRGHIHHMVLGLGFSTRKAALLLYGFCGLSAFFGHYRQRLSWWCSLGDPVYVLRHGAFLHQPPWICLSSVLRAECFQARPC